MTVHFRVYSCTICFSHRSTCFIFCCSLHVFCTWMSLTQNVFKRQTGRKTFTLAGNRIYTLEIKRLPNHFDLKCYLIIISSVLHLHTYHISWSRRLISRSVASIYTRTPVSTWTAKTHGNNVFFLFPEKAFFLSLIRDDWYIFALYWCLCVSIFLYILLLFYKTDSLTGLFSVNTLPSKTQMSRLNCFLGGKLTFTTSRRN